MSSKFVLLFQFLLLLLLVQNHFYHAHECMKQIHTCIHTHIKIHTHTHTPKKHAHIHTVEIKYTTTYFGLVFLLN